MPASIFLNEIIPVTETESPSYSWDSVLLPSGDRAILADTGAEMVVQIFSPGVTDPRVQFTLPTPEDQTFAWNAQFVTAPDGSVAVFFETQSQRHVPDGYGGYYETDRVYLNAVSLADDGSSLSDLVALDSRSELSGYWDNYLYFNNEGFAAVSNTYVYDDDYYYSNVTIQLHRLAPDGEALGDPITLFDGTNFYGSRSLALPDGRMALLSEDNSEDVSQMILRVFAADGTVAISPQILPLDSGEYISIYDSHMITAPDGTVSVLYMQYNDDGNGQVKLIGTDSSGALLPVVDLPTLNATLGDYSFLRDVQIFADGSLGLLLQDQSTGLRIIYQHVAADGTAIGEPAVLFENSHSGSFPQITLLPDGGAVMLMETYLEAGGQTLSVQYFDANGVPLGPEAILSSTSADSYLYSTGIQLQGGDHVQISWSEDSYDPDTGGYDSSTFHTTISPVPFRGLTEENDVEVLSAAEAVDGLAGDDMITGSDGSDRLLGSGGDDTLIGAAGDDFLYGGSGSNILTGGDGTDAGYFAAEFADFSFVFNSDGSEITVIGADSRDVTTGLERFDFTDQSLSSTELLVEGGFYDGLLEGSDGADSLDAGLGDDTVRGGAGNDTLTGGAGRDRINGGAGDDLIIGGSDGADTDGDRSDLIFGGEGNDTADGGGGNDLIYGQAGDDLITGGFGADQLFGQTGNDVISGGAWSDLLFGGDGDDFLNGGWGHDRVNGGAGADTFFHAGVHGHGSDWLQDYNAGEGDVLLFGNATARPEDFNIHFAHSSGAGDSDVAEAFVIYTPTGVLAWALVDGAAQDQILLKIPDFGTFDLLA